MSGEGLIAEPRAVHASAGHARLKELMHRGTEFLGCDVAIELNPAERYPRQDFE